MNDKQVLEQMDRTGANVIEVSYFKQQGDEEAFRVNVFRKAKLLKPAEPIAGDQSLRG